MNVPLQSLLSDVKIDIGLTAVAAGTSDQNTAVFDMQGYESIAAIALVGDGTSTATVSLDCYENTANSTSGGTAISGSTTATLTSTGSNTDDKLLVSERIRPTKRYVFFTLNRGVANHVINGIIVLRYGANNVPLTQSTDIIGSATSAGN